tara:strand:- start:53 stop:313 length:261 start_codon:yes stop_codon:yes gene_type:complete
MEFKTGEKIVCVKVNPLKTLTKGEIYTVIGVRIDTGGVKLKEVNATDKTRSGYFSEHRFRRIDTKWAENILEEISKKVNILLTTNN